MNAKMDATKKSAPGSAPKPPVGADSPAVAATKARLAKGMQATDQVKLK